MLCAPLPGQTPQQAAQQFQRNAFVRAGLEYHIERAGGLARNPDEDRIAVRYANGDIRTKRRFLLFFSREPEPGPGNLVTVGTKPEPEPFDLTQFLGSVAQIAASTVAIVAIAIR